MKISIDELKQKYRIDQIIERDTELGPQRGNMRRGHHCDKHDNEQELTVFINGHNRGYFYCNRCGLRGDVVAWVGYKLFGRSYVPESRAQLEQIARTLGEIELPQVESGKDKPAQTKDKSVFFEASFIAQAHKWLLCDPQCVAHRRYLAARGIHSDAAKRWLLGAYKREVIIPVAVRDTVKAIVKRRIDEKRYHLLGRADVLFNAEVLPCPEVVICEGPFDAILEMAVYGVPAVSMVGGVQSFPMDYVSKLRACEMVWVATDNDAAGTAMAQKLASLLPNAERFELDQHHDLTDYILALN